MNIQVEIGDPAAVSSDALVVGVFSDQDSLPGPADLIDTALGGMIGKLKSDGEIKGRNGELTVIHTPVAAKSDLAAKRVLVAGLGKEEKLTLDGLRTVSAGALRRLRSLGASDVAIALPGAGKDRLDAEDAAEAVIEGATLGLYRFDRYMSKSDEGDDDTGISSITIMDADSSIKSALETGITRGQIYADASLLARDLVNEPPNAMTPTDLAGAAERAAADSDGLTCTILERAAMEKMGMGAFLGVAQGSHEPPKLIRLEYVGDLDDAENNLWIIGKGITFDSGGLSLKPSMGMVTMKSDMAGGASIIGAIKAIAALAPAINVTGLCLATENMPGGGAQRVGDIVKSMSGKYIEILNTDAEGRLTLADALTYAIENGAKRMVDIATLTGGIVAALGNGNSGAFSNDDALVDAVIAAGKQRGEPMWQLPLDDVSKKQNRSKIADIKNTGGRPAQATTGAHFIGEFADDVPWVHLDIAATAMNDGVAGWEVAGATGVPARTLIQLAVNLAK